MAVLKGIVINGKIVLKEPLVLPEGVEVEIIPPAKYRILKHAGIWKNLDNVDMLIKEIYDSRTISLAEIYGNLKASLKKTGNVIADNDLFIACIAIRDNLKLVTHNIKHFNRIPDLKIEDWLTE